MEKSNEVLEALHKELGGKPNVEHLAITQELQIPEQPEETNEKIDFEKEKLDLEEAVRVMRNMWAAATRVRSIRRAIKRGKLTEYGILVSRRPFNNRANTSKRKGVHSRFVNLIKQRDYEAAKSAIYRQSV